MPEITIEEIFRAAGVKDGPSLVPVINTSQFVKVQKYLGIRTSWEREVATIKQGGYPFAEYTKMHEDEYRIYVIPYLKWINERAWVPEESA